MAQHPIQHIFWVLVILSAGCGSTLTTSPAGPVWSDDAGQRALVKQTTELEIEGGATYTHQIYTQAIDGEASKPLGDLIGGEFREGQDRLYYMRRAGYLLASSRIRRGHLGDYTFYTEHYMLNLQTGQRTVLLKAPDGVHAYFVPSPSGAMIAAITNSDARTAQVAFMRVDLAAPSGGSSVGIQPLPYPVDGSLRFQWRDEARLAIWRSGRGRLDWWVGPGVLRDASNAPIPPCGDRSPSTTSSPVDDRGRRIGVRVEPGERAWESGTRVVAVVDQDPRCVWKPAAE